MSHAVNCDGKQTGVAEDDFVGAVGSGIAIVKGLHICLAHCPDGGKLAEKFQTQQLCPFLGLGFLHLKPQHNGNLLVEVVHHVLNEHGQVVAGIVHPVALIPGRAGVADAQQLADNVRDRLLVRVDKGV